MLIWQYYKQCLGGGPGIQQNKKARVPEKYLIISHLSVKTQLAKFINIYLCKYITKAE